MKFRISIPLIITMLLLGFFLLGSTSCSQKPYKNTRKVSYNRSARIKVYKKPTNNKSYAHQTPVRKKYVIKK